MKYNEDEMLFRQQEREDRLAQEEINLKQQTSSQNSMILQEQEKSMIKDQLDLSEELEMIENLLRGRVLKKDRYGKVFWEDTNDPEMIILSEHGIHLIMNTVTFYINKNTLLSNYDEETILMKMEDFATDLADTIFMEYEKVFQYPTFEDCKNVLISRLDRKKDLKKFTLELLGKEVDENKIENELLGEIQDRLDGEITKIKEQIIKNKLKRFMILIREVQDAVHSTYLRAWKGQERLTLRQHIHITESRGNGGKEQQGSKLNPLNWGR